MTATWSAPELEVTEPVDTLTDVPNRQLLALAKVFHLESVFRQWAYVIVGTIGISTTLAAIGWVHAAIIFPVLALIASDVEQTEEQHLTGHVWLEGDQP